jgi:hypothetical protein
VQALELDGPRVTPDGEVSPNGVWSIRNGKSTPRWWEDLQVKTPFLASALFVATLFLSACLPGSASGLAMRVSTGAAVSGGAAAVRQLAASSTGRARAAHAAQDGVKSQGQASAAPASMSSGASSPEQAQSAATIPGPLRSFLRMAGISQKIAPEEVLPLLARNVVVMGYPDFKEKPDTPSEFLLLLRRYLTQARELQRLAGPEGVIRVSSCAEAGPLLGILGYRLREACGPSTSVETGDADRAFLTIDSGFPLADLEETLRTGTAFTYPFPTTNVPVVFAASDWLNEWRERRGKNGKSGKDEDMVDTLLQDPATARLYWAVSRIDAQTREQLRESPGLPRLEPFSSVLDFYGSHLSIRGGRVVVPGGAAAESAWKSMAGADPSNPGEFITRLLAKDEGWLAVYFDALSSVSPTQQAYFTKPDKLQHFYTAFRGRSISPGPTRHAFRPDPGLILLLTRLEVEPNGQPHVPGSLAVWKDVLKNMRDSKAAQDWSKRIGKGSSPDELVDAMFALSRESSPNGALQVYLLLSEIDRARSPQLRLSPETVQLLAAKFPRFSNQYLVFSEFNKLNNASITRLIAVAEALDRISDRIVRADAMGTMQASAGLWEILARQGQIPEARLNESWQAVIGPFAKAGSAVQLLDADQASLGELSREVTGKTGISQDELIAALAGPRQTTAEGQQMRQEVASKIHAVIDDQRLVSLDTLLVLARGLNQMADGQHVDGDTLVPFAGELREFEMPRPLFTTRERTEWASGLYNVRHTTSQMQTNLAKVIKSGSPAELAAARGQLAPFMRDTLVGLNYAYYEPPGAQMLHHNPLFVRSHDFSGQMTMRGDQAWQTPMLFGRGGTASGGAHLAGSLADLPYVLAQVEQDFIVPENGQSLIWEDLVPDLLTSAILPRWWGVSPMELHAVTLYQRTGEELLTAAGQNDKLRETVMGILSNRMLPQRSEEIEQVLRSGHAEEMVPRMMPAETFYLAAEFRRRYGSERPDGDLADWGGAGKELNALAAEHPQEVSWTRLSEDFGVPHPALEQSYARELLNVEPFPTYLGYSSRLLAECWDSSNLYWARLADELGYSPVMLNRLVPQLTRRMVEKIAASHPEDWMAVLRAMQETGEEFRQSKNQTPGASPASRPPATPSTAMPGAMPGEVSPRVPPAEMSAASAQTGERLPEEPAEGGAAAGR